MKFKISVGLINSEHMSAILEIFYLRSVHRNVMRKFAMNKDKVCTPILTFFRKIVKGSVKIRRIIDSSKNEVASGSGLRKRVALAHNQDVDPERDCNFYKIMKNYVKL